MANSIPLSDLQSYTHFSTPNIIITVLNKLNIQYEIIDKERSYIKFWKNGKEFALAGHGWSINPGHASCLTKYKTATNRIIQRANCPVPKSISHKLSTISNINIINQLQEEKINYPLVIKPMGGTGSAGCITDIQNMDQLIQTLDNRRRRFGRIKMMIEEHIHGESYRILVFKDQVIGVARKVPCSVVGNNELTIKQLVEKENVWRGESGLDEINLEGRDIKEWIINHQIDLESIPKLEERVILTYKHNIFDGGYGEIVDIKEVHPDNLKMFVRATKAVDLILSGIDFISQDITKSYQENGACINEINAFPNFRASCCNRGTLHLDIPIKIINSL